MNLIKEKFKIVYKSKLTYLITFANIFFIIVTAHMSNTNDFYGYLSIVTNDLYLWLVFIPSLVIIHKNGIYIILLNYISRFQSKKNYVLIDSIFIVLSTILICLTITIVPIFYFTLMLGNFSVITLYNIMFLVIRYFLLACIAQLLTYYSMLHFQIIQKNSNYICLIPILIFFVLTLPTELLKIINNNFILILDFSAGGNYLRQQEIMKLNDTIFLNIHLIGYMVFYSWIEQDLLINRLEFNEYDNSNES